MKGLQFLGMLLVCNSLFAQIIDYSVTESAVLINSNPYLITADILADNTGGFFLFSKLDDSKLKISHFQDNLSISSVAILQL